MPCKFSLCAACQLVLSFPWSCLGKHIFEISWVQFHYHILRTFLTTGVLVILISLIFPFHHSWFSLSLRHRASVVAVSPGAAHPLASHFLHFDQLYIQWQSLCCKKKLIWWWMRITLTRGYKDKHFKCSYCFIFSLYKSVYIYISAYSITIGKS